MNNDDSNKKVNTLCWISLACLIAPFILSVFYSSFLENTAMEKNEILSGIFEFIFTVAEILGVVLMLYVRIKYPKNIFGKVVMWLYIIALVIIILLIIFVITLCDGCITGLVGCGDEIRGCDS